MATRLTASRCSGSNRPVHHQLAAEGTLRAHQHVPQVADVVTPPGPPTGHPAGQWPRAATGRPPSCSTRSRPAGSPSVGSPPTARTRSCGAARRPPRRRPGPAGPAHAGSHQARRPSSTITAGTSVIRTRKASTNTPTARPNAICWMVAVPPGMKADEDADHDQRRGRDDPRRRLETPDTASRASPEWTKSSRIAETRNIS